MTRTPEFEKARELAVAFIGIDRSKSSGRVRRNLIKKGVEPSLADQVVAYYREIDYINDGRAARKIAARYQGRRLRSRRAMVAVFIRNGVAVPVAEKEASRLDGDQETALSLCLSHFPRPRREDELAMMKLLTRRGYPAGLSRETVRRCLEGEDD